MLQIRQLKVLLLLHHRVDRLIYLQQPLRKGVIALPDDPLAPLVEGVDVQVRGGDDVDEILQDVIVDANWPGVEALDADHVALVAFLDA